MTPGCTASNPGAYLQRTVLDRLDGVTTDAATLARQIRDRGRDAGRDPAVVFTTYFDPLPDTAVSFARCPDGAGLGPAQLEYMHELLGDLNGALTKALARVSGRTRVADPGPAFAGHRWCDPDPWVYGTSILVSDGVEHGAVPPHPGGPAGHRRGRARRPGARRAPGLRPGLGSGAHGRGRDPGPARSSRHRR